MNPVIENVIKTYIKPKYQWAAYHELLRLRSIWFGFPSLKQKRLLEIASAWCWENTKAPFDALFDYEEYSDSRKIFIDEYDLDQDVHTDIINTCTDFVCECDPSY
jgi:hypothetical protein